MPGGARCFHSPHLKNKWHLDAVTYWPVVYVIRCVTSWVNGVELRVIEQVLIRFACSFNPLLQLASKATSPAEDRPV